MAKPTYKRAERVADQIRMEVADILIKKIKDPRVAFVTITDVDLSSDLRVARIYVTCLSRQVEEEAVFKGLGRAGGFIRTELGRRMELRYIPELIFKPDPSGAYGDRICQILDGLNVQGVSDDDSNQTEF